MVSLVFHSTSAFLLMSLFYFLFSDTYHTCPHIFPHLLSLQATSNSLLPIMLSSTSFYVLLLVHHDATGLFLVSTPHSLVSRTKEVDLTFSYSLFSFLFSFQFSFLYSIFRTRVRVRVIRSCCHTAGHIR